MPQVHYPVRGFWCLNKAVMYRQIAAVYLGLYTSYLATITSRETRAYEQYTSEDLI